MTLSENPLYQAELARAARAPLPWEKLDGKRLLIAGATGLIGRFLIDLLLYRARCCGGACTVLALSRDEKTARACFASQWDSSFFRFLPGDVTAPPPLPRADFLLHAAGNTHPRAYAADPVGTIVSNVLGAKNLLDWAVESGAERFLFLSSVEIYGESRTPDQIFSETDLGELDCCTLRAGYPESKRAGEALCQAYLARYGLDCVIVRLPRVYGPTVRPDDSKASSQFLQSALLGRDIPLRSAGTQAYSYLYVPDAVTALLTVLLRGEPGQAYNAADPGNDVTLRTFAQLCADWAGTRVVSAAPEPSEAAGYSKATRAILNGNKLRALSWQARDSLPSGLRKTLDILSAC